MVNKKRGKKKTNNVKSLKGSYKEVGDYLKESKNYIWGAVIAFFAMTLLGFIFPIFFVEEIGKFIIELLELTKDFNMSQMMWFIFKNNIWSAFSGMILGVLLGVVPIISLVLNGYLLGFVSRFVVNEVGYLALWRLLPHGIFEIPAILISLGLGIKLGMFVLHDKPKEEFFRRFILSLKVFLFVILPLLIIAALIEGALILLLP